MKKHLSDSTEQQTAEGFILEELSSSIGVKLKPSKLSLSPDTSVQVDGLNEKKKVICEIYSRIGKLKGSQPDKVASDFLKMLLIEETLGGSWQKHFCFASDEASSLLKGKSWLASSAKQFGINLHVYSLPKEIAGLVVSAQNRQKMVNK